MRWKIVRSPRGRGGRRAGGGAPHLGGCGARRQGERLNACARALGTCIHSVVATEGEEKSHDPILSSPHLPRTLRSMSDAVCKDIAAQLLQEFLLAKRAGGYFPAPCIFRQFGRSSSSHFFFIITERGGN